MEDKRIKNSYEEVRSLQASIEGLIELLDQELYDQLKENLPYIPDLDIPRIIIDQRWLPPFLLSLGQHLDRLKVIQLNLIHLDEKNSQSVSNSHYFKNKVSKYLKEKGIHPKDKYDESRD